MGRVVSIDGELVTPERACVSVFDRGFLYGDSVYEVVRTYGGEPFELEPHLARLANSAALIGLELPLPLEGIAAEVRRALEASANPESSARIIATRGSGELGLDPALARGGRLIVIVQELVTPPPEAYERGVKLALVGAASTREAIDPAAKTGSHLSNVLAMQQARSRGAYEALRLDREGRITEAASANVFVVRGGELFTPPLAAGILEGITRRVVIELAGEEGVAVREAELWPAELFAAQEAFITSTTRELVPVVGVFEGEVERTIGAGLPGPVTRRLHAAFRARAQRRPA